MSEIVKVYHIEEIMKMLPHRYPFLLVDRFEVEVPGNPIMPGVLQIEAMAQAAGIAVISKDENYAESKRSVLFMGIDGVKFRKQVKPGDQLRIHVEKIKARRNIFVFKGTAMVDGQVASEAELTAMIIE